jgi:hypothetical protein
MSGSTGALLTPGVKGRQRAPYTARVATTGRPGFIYPYSFGPKKTSLGEHKVFFSFGLFMGTFWEAFAKTKGLLWDLGLIFCNVNTQMRNKHTERRREADQRQSQPRKKSYAYTNKKKRKEKKRK